MVLLQHRENFLGLHLFRKAHLSFLIVRPIPQLQFKNKLVDGEISNCETRHEAGQQRQSYRIIPQLDLPIEKRRNM